MRNMTVMRPVTSPLNAVPRPAPEVHPLVAAVPRSPLQHSVTGLLGLLSVLLLVLATRAGAHPGSLDLNGGHYFGNSYHCHMTACEMPDTFDIGRRARDGFMTNRRAREKFFNEDDWSFEQDFDNDCQSTRQELLILTSRGEVRYTNPRNCTVRTGLWLDEYTGQEFTVATQMDVDHIIPRMYAHTHGGDRWPPNKKLQFANDPMNMVMVDRNEIRRKQDRGPNRYLPREEFQCEYARLWEAIAEKYDLRIDNSDRGAIERVLENCQE